MELCYLPEGGDNPWVWGENIFFGKIFAENCMKMKDSGPGGGGASLAPPLVCQWFISDPLNEINLRNDTLSRYLDEATE